MQTRTLYEADVPDDTHTSSSKSYSIIAHVRAGTLCTRMPLVRFPPNAAQLSMTSNQWRESTAGLSRTYRVA